MNKTGKYSEFASFQLNHQQKFKDEYYLVTLDEDKNSTLEKDLMESEKVDANHHISHNKNVGTRSNKAPDICKQWDEIVKTIESRDNTLFVI